MSLLANRFIDIIKPMKHIIHFHISKGEKQYVAQGIELPVVTQGKTLDELIENIKEATALQLKGENLADFDLAPNPSLLVDLEVSTGAHA